MRAFSAMLLGAAMAATLACSGQPTRFNPCADYHNYIARAYILGQHEESSDLRVKRLLNQPTPAYLIDASMWMNSPLPGGHVRKVDLARRWVARDGSDIYAYNSCIDNTHGEHDGPYPLERLEARCLSPLYQALINTMCNGNYGSITVIGDGDDEGSDATLEEAITRAKANGTRIDMIVFGEIIPSQKGLCRLTGETGGTLQNITKENGR